MSVSAPRGVRIAGIGSAVPERVLSNADLEQLFDTSDEWIRKRTGISERRICDPERGEGSLSLSTDALRAALDDANMSGDKLDLIILASVTSEMTCPSNACRVAAALGAAPAAAFDLVAACSGFVYASNVADSLIRSGRHQRIGVIGCDAMSSVMDYDERTVSILFGDAAGALVLEADDDPDRGCIYQRMHADGTNWPVLYLPRRQEDVVENAPGQPTRLGCLRMGGREVYKFAVTTFIDLMKRSLDEAGLQVDDIAQYVCHQSNARIIESAVEKLNLPEERVYVNIGEYGNSSAGSVGLCFDQCYRDGRFREGDLVMLIAFGGGLTWASSIWRI